MESIRAGLRSLFGSGEPQGQIQAQGKIAKQKITRNLDFAMSTLASRIDRVNDEIAEYTSAQKQSPLKEKPYKKEIAQFKEERSLLQKQIKELSRIKKEGSKLSTTTRNTKFTTWSEKAVQSIQKTIQAEQEKAESDMIHQLNGFAQRISHASKAYLNETQKHIDLTISRVNHAFSQLESLAKQKTLSTKLQERITKERSTLQKLFQKEPIPQDLSKVTDKSLSKLDKRIGGAIALLEEAVTERETIGSGANRALRKKEDLHKPLREKFSPKLPTIKEGDDVGGDYGAMDENQPVYRRAGGYDADFSEFQFPEPKFPDEPRAAAPAPAAAVAAPAPARIPKEPAAGSQQTFAAEMLRYADALLELSRDFHNQNLKGLAQAVGSLYAQAMKYTEPAEFDRLATRAKREKALEQVSTSVTELRPAIAQLKEAIVKEFAYLKMAPIGKKTNKIIKQAEQDFLKLINQFDKEPPTLDAVDRFKNAALGLREKFERKLAKAGAVMPEVDYNSPAAKQLMARIRLGPRARAASATAPATEADAATGRPRSASAPGTPASAAPAPAAAAPRLHIRTDLVQGSAVETEEAQRKAFLGKISNEAEVHRRRLNKLLESVSAERLRLDDIDEPTKAEKERLAQVNTLEARIKELRSNISADYDPDEIQSKKSNVSMSNAPLEELEEFYINTANETIPNNLLAIEKEMRKLKISILPGLAD